MLIYVDIFNISFFILTWLFVLDDLNNNISYDIDKYTYSK